MNQEKLPDLRSLYRQIALETESHNGDLFLAENVEEQDQEKLLFTAGADGEGRPAGILWSNGVFLPQHIDELMRLPSGHISEIDGKKVFFSRFGSRPRVVVCGAGHVALSLIRILKMLGPEIWVIEDRESFALGAKEAGADEVICTASGSYVDGLSKVPRSSRNYFVCMTRGHAYDFALLSEILKIPFAYVGMMGSRSRSEHVRKELVSSGFSPELVNRIHAPIGLDIGAATPEEIAVSVAAELISVWSRESAGSISFDENILKCLAADAAEESVGKSYGISEECYGTSGDQLGNSGDRSASSGEHFVLCTIIEKHGSAPRMPGTRMLVGAFGSSEDDTTGDPGTDTSINHGLGAGSTARIAAGTIGGGLVEAKVCEAAAEMLRSAASGIYTPRRIMDLSVTDAEIVDGGMLCGGSICVLLELIP